MLSKKLKKSFEKFGLKKVRDRPRHQGVPDGSSREQQAARSLSAWSLNQQERLSMRSQNRKADQAPRWTRGESCRCSSDRRNSSWRGPSGSCRCYSDRWKPGWRGPSGSCRWSSGWGWINSCRWKTTNTIIWQGDRRHQRRVFIQHARLLPRWGDLYGRLSRIWTQNQSDQNQRLQARTSAQTHFQARP